MIFKISERNADRARRYLTTAPNPHTLPGYRQSAIIKPKNPHLHFYYEICVIDNTCIVCTARHDESGTKEVVVKLSGYTHTQIEIEHGELYRNCSNYPYRREYNERYLKKYDQIACIVHGAITAGLLYPTEAPTSPEAITAEETTTTAAEAHREPQTAPEDMTLYKVQARSAGRPWHDYSSPATLAECQTIKARAEARQTLSTDGQPIIYRIAPTEAPKPADSRREARRESTPTPGDHAHKRPARPTGAYYKKCMVMFLGYLKN